jgi:hypothetical protein
MPGARLDVSDAAALAGLLQFLSGWRAKSSKGGGFAAADFLARRAGYGAAPPAPRVLRIALRATALRAALDPGDLGGPCRQEERAGPGLPRHAARRANPAVAGTRAPPDAGGSRSTGVRSSQGGRKITRIRYEEVSHFQGIITGPGSEESV